MSEVIDIDGSLLEGGGQILRVALAISAIKRIPIRIYKIRAGRKKPGLMEQHLKGVELISKMCNATVTGAQFGSMEISFYPEDLMGGFFKSYINTAGSVSLLLQVAIPCAIFANSAVKLELHGGTNAEMAPQIDYMTEVFRPNLEKFGSTFNFDLYRRGYFPKGGGEVSIKFDPGQYLQGINLTDFGSVVRIAGWSFVAGTLPPHLSNKMANGAKRILKRFQDIDIECYKEDRAIAPDNATGIILVAFTDTKCILGASALGRKSEDCEDTGARAAEELLTSIEQKACVDEHCQDQIIIFMALAKGPSKVKVGEITLHTKTAIFVVETLMKVKFNIVPTDDGGNIINCSGSETS